MSEKLTDEFLGRAWVPLTLVAVTAVVIGTTTASVPVLGFLLAEVIVAFSIGFRLTWERRHLPHYWTIMASATVAHFVLFALLHGMFARAPGAAYMFAALADAVLITALVKSVLPLR